MPALQANKAQLAAAVASQVEATKLGLDQLMRAHQVGERRAAGLLDQAAPGLLAGGCRPWARPDLCPPSAKEGDRPTGGALCAPHPRRLQALVGMRANYAEITRLCAECQSLIDCHDKIAVLSEVHSNLRKTLQVGAGSVGRLRMLGCGCGGVVALAGQGLEPAAHVTRSCGPVTCTCVANCRMWRTLRRCLSRRPRRRPCCATTQACCM